MQRVFRLRFVNGPLAGRVHEYRDHDVLTVGRAREAAIRLPADDDLASRCDASCTSRRRWTSVPAGPQFDWARAVTRAAPTRADALLVTEAAAAALPRAALANATWLQDVAVGRDGRSTRLANLAPPSEPS